MCFVKLAVFTYWIKADKLSQLLYVERWRAE